MKNTFKVISLALFPVLILASFSQVSVPLSAPHLTKFTIVEDTVVSFIQDIYPLIYMNCCSADCHGINGTPRFNSFRVIKGKSKSIIERLHDKKNPMPPLGSGFELTKEEIHLFDEWVKSGSPNN